MNTTIVRPADPDANVLLREKWHRNADQDLALDRRDAGSWQGRGICRQMDPDLWFPEAQDAAGAEFAKALCGGCPVRAKCLADALANLPAYGVWGGQDFDTERARYNREKDRKRASKAAAAAKKKAAETVQVVEVAPQEPIVGFDNPADIDDLDLPIAFGDLDPLPEPVIPAAAVKRTRRSGTGLVSGTGSCRKKAVARAA